MESHTAKFCITHIRFCTRLQKAGFSEGDRMDTKKIGLFISELRKEQGLKQSELAEKLHVTNKAVSKWETGRGIPDVSILQPLSAVLNTTVTELLNGERAPKQENMQEHNEDEKLIKKLKIKKYIRFAAEAVITGIFAFVIYLFHETFSGFANVLDLYLHQKDIEFLSICTLIFIAIAVLWLLTVILTAIFRKKASVLKTIIICLAVSFVAGTSIWRLWRTTEIYKSTISPLTRLAM